jgi:hypothetical protein
MMPPNADGKTSKHWRWKYRYDGKEKRLALGSYPEVSLASARRARDSAKDTLRAGSDPVQAKKDAKLAHSLRLGQHLRGCSSRLVGYADKITGHGFHGVASTILHERGFDHAHIEPQLTHMERNEVSAAYNFATYKAPVGKMMQAWTDHLDAVRRGGVVMRLAA